jgi:EGF domain
MIFGKLHALVCIAGSLALVACADASGESADPDSGSAERSDSGNIDDDPPPEGGLPVDECANGTANCDVHATCTDLPDGFRCTCKPGFTGNGTTCTDVDECKTSNGGCDSNATCTNTPGSFTCQCNQGYSGNGKTCADDDECSVNNGGCSPNATCTNTTGSFACACNQGYSGDGKTCADDNECSVNNGGCSPNATCTNTPGSFTCACSQGYSGDGMTCTDNNECAVNNGGCSPNATCTNTTGSFTCACNQGYSGNGMTCTDVNECSVNNGGCSPNATCTNTPGSFTCQCKAGYSGDGMTCILVDPCAANNGGCSPNATCTNTPAGAACACKTGFSGDGLTCTDINECAANNGGCDPNATCTNTPGSFGCACKIGFSGDGTTCTNSTVQIDVGALLVDDVVVNTVGGVLDTTQSGIDGVGNNLMTQSAANQIRPGFTNAGIPDDATFAADANHPLLKLGWSNADDGPNARIVKSGSFTITVPSRTYTQFQIFAVSTEGKSVMQFALNYDDGTTETRNVTFGDWYDDPAPAGTFYIINGLDRATNTNTYQQERDPAIAGANLNPNTGKTLTSVVVNHQPSVGWFVFFGALGW